jgi:hypothetical protein
VGRSSVFVMEKASVAGMVRGWVDALAWSGSEMTDVERIELLRGLEELKAAAAAAQARVSVDFDASQCAEQAAAGLSPAGVGRGVAEQVALARRESPSRGGRRLGAAKALVREMPCTLAALTAGRISEWRAEILVRETGCLDRADRGVVDAELAGPGRLAALEAMGDRAVANAAKQVAYRLDPQAVTDRARRAEKERRVMLRPAPDTMSYLTGLLPVAQGVACLAALNQAAATARASGDPRSRGQVMADALVAALTQDPRAAGGSSDTTNTASTDDTDDTDDTDGAGTADSPGGPFGAPGRRSGGPGGPPAASAGVDRISVQLVMTDRTLLGGDCEPAHLVGYGTVPAGWARDLLRDTDAQVWLRRLYTHPDTGDLLAADAKARLFTGVHREVLIARDQICRTPWCDAPIRHLDHSTAKHRGGETSRINGQGLCERCNYAKEAPGWTAHATRPPRDRHTVTTTTPTGDQYHSRAPAPPGSPHSAPSTASHLEYHFAHLTLAT